MGKLLLSCLSVIASASASFCSAYENVSASNVLEANAKNNNEVVIKIVANEKQAVGEGVYLNKNVESESKQPESKQSKEPLLRKITRKLLLWIGGTVVSGAAEAAFIACTDTGAKLGEKFNEKLQKYYPMVETDSFETWQKDENGTEKCVRSYCSYKDDPRAVAIMFLPAVVAGALAMLF